MLTPPSEVTHVLNLVGAQYPSGDEDKTNGLGGTYTTLAASVRPTTLDAYVHAQRAIASSSGPAITNYAAATNDPSGPHKNLSDAATAAEIIGFGHKVLSLIILGLKIGTIVSAASTAIELFTSPEFSAMILSLAREWLGRLKDVALNEVMAHA